MLQVTPAWIQGLRSSLDPALQSCECTLLTALTASLHLGAEAVPLIYDEAIAQHAPRGSQAHDQQAIEISRRIKEALLKGSVLFGIPSTIDSILALLPKLRQDAQTDPGRNDVGFFLRKDARNIDDTVERGMDHIKMIYRHNFADIESRFDHDMEDIKALTLDINYGWNLSDTRVLSLPSTELVILAALIGQNLRAETLWHFRGCLRAGWTLATVENVRNVCIDVATQAGRPTHKVPQVDEVREDSNDL